MRPGVNGTFTSWPASFAAFLDRGDAAQHDQVGQRDLLAACVSALNSFWMASSLASTLASSPAG
jgi:hypothetical protein